MDRVLDVTVELKARVKPSFEPYEGVYRLNDFAEYVSERDWDEVWSHHPSWWPDAWLLADNGQYTADDVSRMTVHGIERTYDDPAFVPEFAYYTETDEEGLP